jgi:hypothetical protein
MTTQAPCPCLSLGIPPPGSSTSRQERLGNPIVGFTTMPTLTKLRDIGKSRGRKILRAFSQTPLQAPCQCLSTGIPPQGRLKSQTKRSQNPMVAQRLRRLVIAIIVRKITCHNFHSTVNQLRVKFLSPFSPSSSHKYTSQEFQLHHTLHRGKLESTSARELPQHHALSP